MGAWWIDMMEWELGEGRPGEVAVTPEGEKMAEAPPAKGETVTEIPSSTEEAEWRC